MPTIKKEKSETTTRSPFVKAVAKYFMNFLETDFKKRKIPKRNTIQKTQNGFKVGFGLERYPKLKKNLLNLLNSGFKKETFDIKKGEYTQKVPDSLLKLILKKIETLPKKRLAEVYNEVKKILEEKVELYSKEYDKFLEESKEETRQLLAKHFILPFLDDLDKPLGNFNIADENSKYQLEVDITDSLFSVFEGKYTEVLQSFFHRPDEIDLSDQLSEIITLSEIKDRLVQFFESFAIGDAFYDLYQIYRSNQLTDKNEIYLYFYEISLGNEKFPIIYLPIAINRENNKFTLRFDKRLFINTKAIDFVVQECNDQRQKKNTLASEFERIVYINGDDNFSLEIETIIMVATREKDRLNWIFLKNFASINDEVDGTIKSQRLNVGFSRAKECIHFILSKPIEEYLGELKNALIHYHNELEGAKKKIIGGTDQNSKMEHKIQHYFYETIFYKENKEKIEFIPQFELGKYLRQLDKAYRHPDYRVDFLLIYGDQKVIIEYDGFKEHFENREEINGVNYSYYMKDDDIYRQKVLEGYGYKFLRINRFNIGNDPTETLNDRLQNLVKKTSKMAEREKIAPTHRTS